MTHSWKCGKEGVNRKAQMQKDKCSEKVQKLNKAKQDNFRLTLHVRSLGYSFRLLMGILRTWLVKRLLKTFLW